LRQMGALQLEQITANFNCQVLNVALSASQPTCKNYYPHKNLDAVAINETFLSENFLDLVLVDASTFTTFGPE